MFLINFTGKAVANGDVLFVERRPLLHTYVEIKAWGPQAELAVDAAFAEMEQVNMFLNNYDPKSDISRINQNAGKEPVAVNKNTFQALTLAVSFGELSGGAFDCTVGPLLALWGFAKEEAGISGSDPSSIAVLQTRQLVDYRSLVFQSEHDQFTVLLKKKGMQIDVGAFSKGYVADCGLSLLKKKGIGNALIAAGGTISAMGVKPDGAPWKVGVRHPRNDGAFITVLSLKDTTVSTSGDYEKFYYQKGKRRTHIIDPRSGVPVEAVQAVSVIADKAVMSDGISTALFVLGAREGIALVDGINGVEALIIDQKGNIVLSQNWPQKMVVY